MNDQKSKEFDEKLDSLSAKYGLKKEPEKQKETTAAEGYVLGISLFSHTLIGLFIGLCIDKFADTAPLFIIIFLFLGFISGFRHIWKNVK